MNDILDLIDEIKNEGDDNSDLDYWNPLSKIIGESIEIRSLLGISQQDLAKEMDTRQSAISRFENMGRLPSYNFIARLALALGHKPGLTLYGEYMAIVPTEDQALINAEAKKSGISTQLYTQYLLERGVVKMKNINQYHGNGSSLGLSSKKTMSCVDTAISTGVQPCDEIDHLPSNISPNPNPDLSSAARRNYDYPSKSI